MTLLLYVDLDAETWADANRQAGAIQAMLEGHYIRSVQPLLIPESWKV